MKNESQAKVMIVIERSVMSDFSDRFEHSHFLLEECKNAGEAALLDLINKPCDEALYTGMLDIILESMNLRLEKFNDACKDLRTACFAARKEEI